MAAYDTYTVDSIDSNVGQFKVEKGQVIGKVFDLLNYEDFPNESKEFIDEINSRGRIANEMYKLSRHREQMFASGFKAGMYICKFDENEQMTSFEFTDGTRDMLGYDGLDDLPNEFDSWIKTLIPEERDLLVKLFWDTVKIHRELPDISHAEYRMMKKDGSIIWVTGAGEFIRREDGSLEIYMGCYREVTAEHEKAEHIRIIEGIGKIFNFSIYIDVKTQEYRFISSNEYVDKIERCANAFEFLRANVDDSVAIEFRDGLKEWFNCDTILDELKHNTTIDRDFYSDAADAWFKGVFIVSDYDDNGDIAHIIYGCQNIDDSKRNEEILIKKSHTDELTGANNRRAYEDKIDELEQTSIAEDFVYISVDVNGLKVVNDTLGHAAGDELIIGACDCLNRTLGKYGNVYRTGGDEFVVLVNANEEQLKTALELLEMTTEKWSGSLVDSLSLSYGYVTSHDNQGMTIHDISVLADKEMYKAKSAHYAKKGVDRRGQAAAHTALCNLYTKILKINITEDTYSIVNMDTSEQTTEKGFADTISGWLSGFGKSGQVHEDDLEEYLTKTDLVYLRRYFNEGKTSISIQYRRKYSDGFKQVAMDMIPADDYSAENQTLFLYVKNIEM
ncbi:MAG: sensor domain-containing diguanylate cyclase [Lachnospiraceae bacterium]|nr:sensor domain-containing diguanylate cyclase [Lachnospiraceae bacterium]